MQGATSEVPGVLIQSEPVQAEPEHRSAQEHHQHAADIRQALAAHETPLATLNGGRSLPHPLHTTHCTRILNAFVQAHCDNSQSRRS